MTPAGVLRRGLVTAMPRRVPRYLVREAIRPMGLKATHHVPTPTASDHIERRPTRTDRASAFNPETNKTVSLDRWVAMWPTPMAGDWHGGMVGADGKVWGLTGAVNTADGTDGKLNPRWVEWLMGFPAGWAT